MDRNQNVVKICQNHLPDLYKAIEEGDLAQVKKIEHELTPAEECVACSYIFKTRGTVKQALENFLSGEGFEVESVSKKGRQKGFWAKRLIVFSGCLLLVSFIEILLRKSLFKGPFNLLGLNIVEYILVGFFSIVVFLFIDDIFLE